MLFGWESGRKKSFLESLPPALSSCSCMELPQGICAGRMWLGWGKGCNGKLKKNNRERLVQVYYICTPWLLEQFSGKKEKVCIVPEILQMKSQIYCECILRCNWVVLCWDKAGLMEAMKLEKIKHGKVGLEMRCNAKQGSQAKNEVGDQTIKHGTRQERRQRPRRLKPSGREPGRRHLADFRIRKHPVDDNQYHFNGSD